MKIRQVGSQHIPISLFVFLRNEVAYWLRAIYTLPVLTPRVLD